MASTPTHIVLIERCDDGFLVRLPVTHYEDRIVSELRMALSIADRVTGGDFTNVLVNVDAVNEGRKE